MQLSFPGQKAVPRLVLVRRDLQRENTRRQQHALSPPGCASCASFNSIRDNGDNGGDGGSNDDSDGATCAPRPEGTVIGAQTHYAATLPARGGTVYGPLPPLSTAHTLPSAVAVLLLVVCWCCRRS